MQKTTLSRQRPHERGQTIILVAVSLVSLLAMAALAIDIVTLYSARSEVQRAADAAALAGAKAIADSGFTTLPAGDPNYPAAQTLAQQMATASINAMVTTPAINLVGGQFPVLPGSPTFDLGINHPGSYQVSVTLNSQALPTFFSKIWSRSGTTVTATATAEAYNPANLPTMTPISLKSVKPWLVANADPTRPPAVPLPAFITNTATGAVEANVIGETFNLTADCQPSAPCQLITSPVNHNPPIATFSLTNPQVDYVPAPVTPTNPKNVCPACAGATDYEQSISCADANAYTALSCGGGATNATWDNSNNPGDGGASGLSATGTECLINASTSGSGKGQDTLDKTPWPTGPMQMKAQSGPLNGQLVMTSNSVVTIPIIDNSAALTPNGPVTIVGFMQAFINMVQDGTTPGTNPGDINITVLNIAACSPTNNSANPVVGGSGTSPVPVRLITSP